MGLAPPNSVTGPAQVLDDELECALGVLEFPLSQLLPCADLTLEQCFQLDHSGLDSLISMRLVLRVNSSCLGGWGWGGTGPSTEHLLNVKARREVSVFIFQHSCLKNILNEG